ncbi:hypothetical protein E4T56_gene18255 [Termitomyces sp. T112]|nr:hypothetical protein E4T56_gene18255 [Termitomyces sp. T112]KAH0586956.1 hypothetical protein H2248_005786 [Termitomyces sp. 'cryptogamus']
MVLEPVEHEGTSQIANASCLVFGTLKPDPNRTEDAVVRCEEDLGKLRINSWGTGNVKDEPGRVKQEHNDIKVDLLKVPYLAFGKFKSDSTSKQEEGLKVKAKLEQDVKRDLESLQAEKIKADDVGSGYRDSTPDLFLSDSSLVKACPAFGTFKRDESVRVGVKVKVQAEDPALLLDQQTESHDVDMDIDDLLEPLPQPTATVEQDTPVPVQIDLNETVVWRQSKRRRVIMDAIVLPTCQEVLRCKATNDAEEFEKMKKMKNPKVNMKKVEFCFSVNTICDRLRPIGLDPYQSI